MKEKCFTIGHSTHDIKKFISLLKKNNINCIIDVRSTPYSKFAPQYNKELLKKELKKENILYSNFAKEFGARQRKIEFLFDDGKVCFEKFRNSEEFLTGVKRIKNGLEKKYQIALMCSEKNPFDCHRFSLVSHGLEESGIEILHILEDNKVISNVELEEKLIKKYKISYGQMDFLKKFKTKEEAIKEGYEKRNLDIAYSEGEEDEGL